MCGWLLVILGPQVWGCSLAHTPTCMRHTVLLLVSFPSTLQINRRCTASAAAQLCGSSTYADTEPDVSSTVRTCRPTAHSKKRGGG